VLKKNPAGSLHTSVGQRGAAAAVGAGVAGTTLAGREGAARRHVHDVLQDGVGPAGFGVERQLPAVQAERLQAAAQPVGDGRAAAVAAGGGQLAHVAAEVNAVVEVEGPQGARRRARGGVHPVQHQLGVVAVHLQRERVPLAVVDLRAVHRHDAGAAAAVKLVLQAAVHDLPEP